MLKITKDLLIAVLTSGLIFAGFVGCGNDDEEEGEAPPLPPEASMTMDLSAFGGGKMAPSLQLPGRNYTAAATRVLLLNAAVVITLAPAASVFKASINETPELQDDGSWLWSYSATFLGNEFNANLFGQLQGLKTVWSMMVTADLREVSLTDFQWYTGETNLANTSGNWIFFDYRSPSEVVEIGTIDWDVDVIGKSELVFSFTRADSEFVGDILTYSVEGTTASITYFDASESVTSEIEWDLETTAGSIQVPGYNNGERAYWDADKQDYVP